MDTGRTRYHTLQSHTEGHQRQAQDPAPDVTRASGEDHVGGRRRDERRRDDVSATWGSRNSCTLVTSSVLRDSSSGDDVVRDSWGEVCSEVVKDEERQYQCEMLRSVDS